MSLIDLTPLGAPLSVNEAYRDAREGNYTGAALNGLGAVLGAAPALAGIGKGAKNLASRSTSIYNPPVKPARPFEADYPAGAPADARGRLTQDLDGRPLTARYVVGRETVGGSDVALSREALDETATAAMGGPANFGAQSTSGPDLGRAVFGRDGSPREGTKNLASRSTSSYDPQVQPARPFEADYPAGAPADASGKLTHTIDEEPITAHYVAGRREAGGTDVALPDEASGEIAKATIGHPANFVAQSTLGRDVGRLRYNRYTGQPVAIDLSRALTPRQNPRVYAHEIGHVIDQISGEIPTAGLSDELRGVYNSLNNGHRNAAGTDARANAKPFLPQHNGYKGDDIPREYMAEAIRAYMADPNYLKTVAPKTAARIREYVNPNPKLNRTIQFNSIAAPAAGLAAGGAVLAGSDDAKASARAPELPPGAVLIGEPPVDAGS
jgi:hypothetical protein